MRNFELPQDTDLKSIAHDTHWALVTLLAPKRLAVWALQELYSLLIAGPKTHCTNTFAGGVTGTAGDVVGIWRGAISGHMKVSFQAARSIG
jgi:hypothetical protein